MEESGDQSFSRQPITLTTWDVVAIVAYFITILAVGLSVRKMNKVPQYHCYVDFFPFQAMWRPNRNTVSGFFLAGRHMWFLPVSQMNIKNY